MRILVAGAGGALGGHLVKRLLEDGHEVRAVDIKPASDWWQYDDRASCWDYVDLSFREHCDAAVNGQERIFNLACDMGGIGYITGNRADCASSVLINTNLLRAAAEAQVSRYWYASSACVYPASRQNSPEKGFSLLKEGEAWPAQPEEGYGEEKLFSEQLCRYAAKDWGIETRIARLHNVYGPHSTWRGGREKAPAALCRKVAEAKRDGSGKVEIWGDGKATRSFLFVDDFVEGAIRIMDSEYGEPVNLGSEEVVTIDVLCDYVEDSAGVELQHEYDVKAPVGVAGRGSDNTLLRRVTGWEPQVSLQRGIDQLYDWVETQVAATAVARR